VRKVSVIEDARRQYHEGARYIGGLGLLSLLDAFRPRAATDPRDKVYGLLGMNDSLDSLKWIEPEYSLSVSQCYQLVVASVIFETSNLRALPNAGAERALPNLPSWVPDFTMPITDWQQEKHRTARRELYVGSKSNGGNIDLYSDSVLGVTGIRVDIIVEIGDIMDGVDERALCGTIREWSRMTRLAALHHRNIPPPPYVGGSGDQLEAFWRTMLADCVYERSEYHDGYRRSNPNDLDSCLSWWASATDFDWTLSGLLFDLRPNGIQYSINTAVAGQRFF